LYGRGTTDLGGRRAELSMSMSLAEEADRFRPLVMLAYSQYPSVLLNWEGRGRFLLAVGCQRLDWWQDIRLLGTEGSELASSLV
jgi:hypothetical protein